jgi:hypothetical protein
VPSQSVEAATRDEAIAAAREEYGPSVKIVGVRRIRSGGVMGFFANERFVAEVDLSVARAEEPARRGAAGTDAGRRGGRSRAESEDDRMTELADLLRPASGEMPLGLYSSSGVTPAPAIEDLVAQQRPRAAAPRTASRPSAPRTTTPAESPWGVAPTRGTTPRTAAPAQPAVRVRTVAEARPAVKADPFAPKRHRPTLDFPDPAAEPVAEAAAAPAAPSPFTAALARMVADREVSAAVEDAVERSAEPAAAEPAVLRQPVFEDEVEDEVEETFEPFVEEPVAESPAAVEPVAEPVAETMWAEEPVAGPMDQRAALQSALASVLTAAGPGATDPDVERLLAGVLERVLAGDATPALSDDSDEDDMLTATGRHRLPESAQLGSAQAEEVPVDDDLFDAGLFGTGLRVDPVEVERVAFEQVPAAAEATRTDGWDDEARHEEVQVHDIRTPDVHAQDFRTQEFRTQEFRMDLRDHEVLAHREPLVMTPSMAAWPSMARTASDPAPLSLDATTILPPLSLLPPQRMPSIGGMPPLLKGRPAVPPPRRPLNPGPSTDSRPVAARPAGPLPSGRSVDRASLEVTATHRDLRLPLGIAPVPDGERRLATVTRLVRSVSREMASYGLSQEDELVVRLLALGLPEFLIAPDFAADAAVRGTYAALTRTLTDRLPALPEVPTEPGDVLLVVGPGPETLTAARSLAVSLRLDPARVQWATPSDAAHLAPEHSRITTLETAVERAEHSAGAGSVTIVAVDAPLRTGGGGWLAQMLSIWAPVAVWGVVDATRKLEDVVPWLDGLPRLDAVVVQDTDCTADPAAVLSHVTAPVARVDGARATAHRWASLLCERLEEMH